MPRWNYTARRNPKVEKKPACEVKKQRMYDLLDLIQNKKELKYFDAQRILNWGDGIMERISREVISYYDNELKFDKEKRMFFAIDMKIKNEVEIKN